MGYLLRTSHSKAGLCPFSGQTRCQVGWPGETPGDTVGRRDLLPPPQTQLTSQFPLLITLPKPLGQGGAPQAGFPLGEGACCCPALQGPWDGGFPNWGPGPSRSRDSPPSPMFALLECHEDHTGLGSVSTTSCNTSSSSWSEELELEQEQ